MQREIISVHIGQAGIQIGNALWELLCLEHGVNRDGSMSYEMNVTEQTAISSIFSQIIPHDKYVPRTILADLEPTVIDEVRTGAYKDLYYPDYVMAGMEDAAGNFARGYYTLGGKVVGTLINAARKSVETCDIFQGFMSYSSISGGTGSGLLSMFQERAALEFAGHKCMQFSIIPSEKLSTAPVEVYNAVHQLYRSKDYCDMNCLMDNESLYDICANQLSILRPTYSSVNRALGPLLSGVTASMRFKSHLNAHINEYLTNLIPFPSVNFPMLSFAPFCTNAESERTKMNTDILTRMVFKPSHRTVSANVEDGVSLATCLTYRGIHDIPTVCATLNAMRKNNLFIVDWCPTGFKVAYTPQPSIAIPGMGPDKINRSCVMLCNNTEIANVFQRMCKTYGNLFSKKAFVHWYVGEGMEEAEFTDAYNSLVTLSNDIAEMETDARQVRQDAEDKEYDAEEDYDDGDDDDDDENNDNKGNNNRQRIKSETRINKTTPTTTPRRRQQFTNNARQSKLPSIEQSFTSPCSFSSFSRNSSVSSSSTGIFQKRTPKTPLAPRAGRKNKNYQNMVSLHEAKEVDDKVGDTLD